MVEDVEEFSAELEGDGLFDDGPLGNAEVRVVQPRSVEKLAVGVAELSQRTGRKRVREKVSVRTIGSGFSGILSQNFSHKIGNIRVAAANKGLISALAKRHRQASRKAGNAVQGPALG